MPIPLIIGAAAAVAGIYGAAKGVSGAIDHKKAKEMNSEAEHIIDFANKKLDGYRKLTNNTIEDYGRRKISALNGVVSDFIETFEQLKSVDLIQSPELDKLKAGDFYNKELVSMRQALPSAQGCWSWPWLRPWQWRCASFWCLQRHHVAGNSKHRNGNFVPRRRCRH